MIQQAKIITKLLFLCVLLGPVQFLCSCSHTAANPDDPEGLFKEAEEAFSDEKYLVALEKYRDIKNRFPYSVRATDAELRMADTYFIQESFIEAESAYEVFKELHPTHSKSDYVQFQIGLSYFNQIPSNSTRDLNAAHRSIDAFQDLLGKFPNSQYVDQAKKFMHQAKTKLADYEFYVADFYFSRKHYLSASYRYAALLQDFPDLGYDEDALYRLGQSYFYIRMYSNAKDALRRLLTKFPNSDYKGGSVSLLDEIDKSN